MDSRRGPIAAGLALALAVAACGSSSAPTVGPGASATSAGSGGRTGLATGLAANLDALSSYRFTWSYFGGDAAPAAGSGAVSSADAGSFRVSGIVVNAPVAAIEVEYEGLRYIQVGDRQWTSLDGTAWYESSGTGTDLANMLPLAEYSQWFDANAAQFAAAGDETRNGIPCVHYSGSDLLARLYGLAASGTAGFRAELWVAREGGYPVSGMYGFAVDAAGEPGTFGYTFDITNVDDPANRVEPPTDVVAVPT